MLIQESQKGNGCKVPFMVNKLGGTYTLRVPLELENELEVIATSERRKRSDIARFLLERGLAAYHRDGLLFEPPHPKEKAANEGGKKESGPRRI